MIALIAVEGTFVSSGRAFEDCEGDELTRTELFEVNWGGNAVVFEADGVGIEPEGGVFTVDAGMH